MPLLSNLVERRKRFYMKELIKAGVYMANDKELLQLTLNQLEKEYSQVASQAKTFPTQKV